MKLLYSLLFIGVARGTFMSLFGNKKLIHTQYDDVLTDLLVSNINSIYNFYYHVVIHTVISPIYLLFIPFAHFNIYLINVIEK